MTRDPTTMLMLHTGLVGALVLACSGPPSSTEPVAGGPVMESSGREAATTRPGDKPSSKVSPDLLALSEAYREARRRGVAFEPGSAVLRIVDDRVVIDATAAGDTVALEADLIALGLRHAAAFGRVVSGELPIDAIPGLDTLASLAFARPAAPARRP
jgi:hypothetical protein